uniref:CD320 antigen n=1 Tax=Jaculus jaculus TaxID=51337 RepID=A0A8C5KV75_JACJA|nr:CD320 antigen [Jaculus jaculus]
MARGRAMQTTGLGRAPWLLFCLALSLEAAPTQDPGPSAGSCPPTKFQCRTSGYCMPLTWQCDGDWDCTDGSDEEECRTEPCAQNGQCHPPPVLPCSCDNISDCPGGTKGNLYNCNQQPCPEGQQRCMLSDACIPYTWHCDGHPDCPDSSDELGCETTETDKIFQGGNATTMGTPVTLASVISLRNATTASVRDPSGNSSAYGVIAATGVLSASLVAAALLLLLCLRVQGYFPPLGLLVAVKEVLLLSERKTSLL